MIPKQLSLKKLQEKTEKFNAEHPVGSEVKLVLDSGETKLVKIDHEATILGGHTAVGWFEGISGCYNLDKVVKEKKSVKAN